MAKVYRLHITGNNNLTDWADSKVLGTDEINEIEEPDGLSDRKLPTSIPSPFASITLVADAFRILADKCVKAQHANNARILEGRQSHHKLVSDSLDVGEAFFNFNKFKDKVEIVAWDSSLDLDRLLNGSPNHQKLGKTIQLFLAQDQQAFNFNQLNSLFILKSTEGSNKLDILGGTSPKTLFFSSTNLGFDKFVTMASGRDVFFDGEYTPLYKRDPDFIVYLYTLQKSVPDFSAKFRELNAYMDAAYPLLDKLVQARIKAAGAANLQNDYDDITVGAAGFSVEVVGIPIRQRKPNTAMLHTSDFAILSSKFNGANKPLVLPIDRFDLDYTYTLDKWDKAANTVESACVPKLDNRSLSQRTLPFVADQYPYLTVSDFLEPYLIRTIYPINKESFFDGNYVSDMRKGFLLPIKKEFFHYFDVKDLLGYMSDGKPMLEILQLESNESVRVYLRIPTKGGKYITYERTYYAPVGGLHAEEPKEAENKGSIVENQFGLALFPNYRSTNIKPHYRVALVDRDISPLTINNLYELKFYKQDDERFNNLKLDVKRRNKKDPSNVQTDFYVLNSNFDLIELSINTRACTPKGLLVPKFRETTSVRQFNFAIDFGTSNTHIEYSIEGNPSEAFDITSNEIQVAKLHAPNADVPGEIRRVFTHDLIPEMIHADYDCSFPTRTVLSESNTVDHAKSVFPLADMNIPFVFEKESDNHYNSYITNLKWSNELANSNRVKAYLGNLFFLIRNKVVLNGGDLSKTKIVWFYPASMTEARYTTFHAIFEELCREYISENPDTLFSMSESTAPFRYYRTKKGATQDVVSIDIGGGTTDVVIYEEKKAALITSFRFAANAIFGDGYGFTADNNGIVNTFMEDIKKQLETNQLFELSKILEAVWKKKKSEEIISFFFSLEKNKAVLGKNIEISFGRMLTANNRYKIIFVIFYASIIYHIAKIMKAKNMSMPSYLTFSGTGSKVLQILTPSDKIIAAFTILIFEKVYGQRYSTDGLTIIRNLHNPKEATSKGGVIDPSNELYDQIEGIKATFIGADNETFGDRNFRYTNIDDDIIDAVESEARKFIDFVFKLDDDFSFSAKFGVPTAQLENYRKIAEKRIREYIKNGLGEKENELKLTGDGNKVPVEETLFFYPILGVINSLVREA